MDGMRPGLALLLWLFAAGCQGDPRPTSIGAHAFLRGEAYRDYYASPQRTCEELLDLLQAQGVAVRMVKTCEVIAPELVARVEPLPASMSRVLVRSGRMSTEQERLVAARLLEDLGARLGG